MDRAAPHDLTSVKGLTTDELRAKNPELAAQLAIEVRRVDGARLVTAIAGMPADVRAKVQQVDLTQAPGDVIDYLRSRLAALSSSLA